MSGSTRRMHSSSYSRTNSLGNTSSSSENLPPRTLARVAREVRNLQKSPPEGIRMVVDPETGCAESLGEIFVDIEGPSGTPYETRSFQLKLVIPSEFPTCPPRGFFLTKIYHPNVDVSNGAICVNTLKRDWTPETTLSHVFSVIRCLLIVPFPESSLNDEAGKLFMDSYEEYARRARLLANVHGRSITMLNKDSSMKSGSKLDGNNDSEDVNTTTPLSVKCANNNLSEGSATNLPNHQKRRDNTSTTKSKKVTDKKNKKKGLKRL